jgi:hypothetical protein
VLEITGVKHGKFIYNMDEKGARIYILVREEVVIPTRIKEIYIGIPKNHISLTIIKYISTNSKAIPLIVIIPNIIIIVS